MSKPSKSSKSKSQGRKGDLLDHDDRAIDAVRKAVRRGDISASAVLEIAKIKSPYVQLFVLFRLI